MNKSINLFIKSHNNLLLNKIFYFKNILFILIFLFKNNSFCSQIKIGDNKFFFHEDSGWKKQNFKVEKYVFQNNSMLNLKIQFEENPNIDNSISLLNNNIFLMEEIKLIKYLSYLRSLNVYGSIQKQFMKNTPEKDCFGIYQFNPAINNEFKNFYFVFNDKNHKIKILQKLYQQKDNEKKTTYLKLFVIRFGMSTYAIKYYVKSLENINTVILTFDDREINFIKIRKNGEKSNIFRKSQWSNKFYSLTNKSLDLIIPQTSLTEIENCLYNLFNIPKIEFHIFNTIDLRILTIKCDKNFEDRKYIFNFLLLNVSYLQKNNLIILIKNLFNILSQNKSRDEIKTIYMKNQIEYGNNIFQLKDELFNDFFLKFNSSKEVSILKHLNINSKHYKELFIVGYDNIDNFFYIKYFTSNMNSIEIHFSPDNKIIKIINNKENNMMFYLNIIKEDNLILNINPTKFSVKNIDNSIKQIINNEDIIKKLKKIESLFNQQ